VFIDTSLGPKEFWGQWSNKKDQCQDQQGRWKKGLSYQKPDKEVDTMKVNVTSVKATEGLLV